MMSSWPRLLGATLRQLGRKSGIREPIIVCNNDHRFLVREESAQADLAAQAIILEPVARNTAAAIAAAALTTLNGADDVILVVLPSDHLIKDTTAFLECMPVEEADELLGIHGPRQRP